MSKVRGKTSFKDEWLDRTVFSEWFWLKKVDNDRTKGHCSLCACNFDVSNMGVSSIRSHASGKKHTERVKAASGSRKLLDSLAVKKIINLTDGVGPGCMPSEVPHSSTEFVEDLSNHPAVKNTLQNFISKDEVIRAEILWALNQIMTHSSGRSFSTCSDVFKLMFVDSEIAKKFQMHKDKLGYMITYGLGPYFQKELARVVTECPFYCISFDESMNHVAQKGQMDIVVRFWEEHGIQTRYLTSTFLGHATSHDLLMHFLNALQNEGLNVKKMLQVAMDGPNVNLKFLKDLKSYLKEDSPSDPELLEFGTCSLHVVHGAYKTAHANSTWEINKFLRSLYYLFKDFPTRRADYVHITGSSIFPMKFCSIRWVENSKVISRAIEMLPHLKKYVGSIDKNPPKSENFQTIKRFVSDYLLPAQLGFMLSVALELEHFLTRFQSNSPLLPFMYTDLTKLLEHLMSRIVKREVMDSANNSKKLLAIDVKKQSNMKSLMSIDIGFAASAALKGLKDIDVLQFKGDCQKFLADVCLKIMLKSPLSYKFVKGVTCLAPAVMVNQSIKTYRITAALEVLVEKNQLSSVQADAVKRDYLDFTSKEEVTEHLKKFSPKNDRLDHFLMDLYSKQSAPKELIHFTQKVLVLFHSNAAVERSFSVNKECLVENLHENSLIAQRATYDAVLAIGGVLNVQVSRKMIHAAKNASALRNEALAKQKKCQEDLSQKRKSAAEEIKKLEVKRRAVLQLAKEEAESLENEVKRLKKVVS